MPGERRQKRVAADEPVRESKKVVSVAAGTRPRTRRNKEVAKDTQPFDEGSENPGKDDRLSFQGSQKQAASILPFKYEVWKKQAEVDALIKSSIQATEGANPIPDNIMAKCGTYSGSNDAYPEMIYTERILNKARELLERYQSMNDEYQGAAGPNVEKALPSVQAEADISRVRELFTLALGHGRRMADGLVEPHARGKSFSPTTTTDEVADMAAEMFAETEARLGRGQWGNGIKGMACAWISILDLLSNDTAAS